MKDELQKTVNDLTKRPAKKVSVSEPLIKKSEELQKTVLMSPSGGQLTWEETVNTQTDNETLYGKTFIVKDTYLPNVLVKLGFFSNNSEARKFIRKTGIFLNGKLTNSSDATNRSTNFEIEFQGIKYQVFKEDR